MICFNGRFGWVPFTDLLSSGGAALNYDSIERSFLWTKNSLDFAFTNDTIETLTKLICNLPKKRDQERITIKIGRALDYISIDKLINLLTLSSGKANLDLEAINYEHIISNSPNVREFEDQIRHPEKDIEQQKEPVIVKLVKAGNC